MKTADDSAHSPSRDDGGMKMDQDAPAPANGTPAGQAEMRTKQTELRAESREEFKDWFDNAPVGFHEVDAEGRLVRINNTELKILGYAAGELLGQYVWKISADEEASRRAVLAKLAGELPPPSEGFERMFRRKDGSVFPVWINDRILKREDGVITGIRTAIKDTTERKQAEEAVRESETQLNVVLESTADGILAVNNKGKVVKANRRFAELWQIPQSLVDAGDDLALLDFTMKQLSDPDAFFKKVQSLYGSDAVDMDTLGFKDGRIFERYSFPMLKDGVITGRVWSFRDITGRKQAEAALNYERYLWQALLDNSPDFIYFKDTQSRFIKATKAQALEFGVESPEAMAGKTDFDFFDESHARPAFEDEQEIIRTGRPVIAKEEREVWNDGRVTWASSSKFPMHDAAGKIIGIIGISRDITGNKLAEAALRQSEERYQALFDRSLDCVFLTDFGGVFLDANQASLDLLGYAREDISALTFASLLTEDQLALAFAVTEEIKNTGRQKHPAEFRLRCKDGRQVYVEIQASLIRRDGKPFAIQSIARDLTDRKRAEASLARLATAVDQSTETIVITDTNGIILYVNPGFEKNTGYTRAEALGQNPRILKSGRHDAEFYRQMWDVLKRGEVWHGRLTNKRKDGTLFEEEATISPLRDAGGKVVNYVAVKRDITREVQLEAQFRQSQKMEAIGTLAGGVAHDFNNILAIIQMQAGLLKGVGKLSPDQLKYADEIGLTVERAAALTRQLLLFSRREAPQSNDLDLNKSIGTMTNMLRRILGEDIGFQLKLSAQPMFVHADAGMMDQVLLNLAVNARDAMPKGGQLVIATAAAEFDELTVSQSAQARPGFFVCLSVADTGSGIPPEILPRIFEPFFTTKGVGKGTGLGLATVFGIVQQHHGWINVYSEFGHGTTFKIYLPRLSGMTDIKIAQKKLAIAPTGKETILLVDDEQSLRATMKMTLTRFGYRILEAPTGVKALEVWKEHREEIGLLLTDLMMPDGMSGKELAQRLLQEKPALKVIYMSGYSAEIAGKDFPLQEGVNFLAKPFETHKLAQAIRESLDKTAGP